MAIPAFLRPCTAPLWLAVGFFVLISAGLCPAAQAATGVTVVAAPTQVIPGGVAIYTVTTSRVNPNRPTKVNYTMGGTATWGTDYTLSGTSGQVVIAAGARSGSVTLRALSNNSSGNHVATMTLRSGTRYTVSSSNQASVTIVNPTPSPTATPTPVPTPTATPSPTPSPIPSPTANPTPTPDPSPTPTRTPSPTPSATPTPTSSPTPAASPTPTPRPTPAQEIWISIRTDGLPGSGTQSDPYDGSTPAKFDALMESFPPYSLIHLVAGTFLTNGLTDVSTGTGFTVKKGQQIIGAGMDVTTVKLMHTNSVDNKHKGDAIACGYNVDGSDSLVSDITVDCNASYFISTYQTNAVQVGAGGLRGNNCTIRNVHVIHAYGSQAGHTEGSALYVDTYYNGSAWQSVVGELIENCLLDQSAGDYGGGICLLNQGNTLGLGTTTSGVVRNNTVKNWAGTSAYGFMGKDIQFTGNTAIDCSLFIYGDTGTNDHITISGNTAICGLGNAASASGAGGFAFFNKAAGASFNNFLIENNTVTVRPAPNAYPDVTYGILLLTGGTPGLASNYVVRNNHLSLDPRSHATTYSAWELHGVNTISIYGNSYDRTPVTYFDLTVTNFWLNGVFMH